MGIKIWRQVGSAWVGDRVEALLSERPDAAEGRWCNDGCCLCYSARGGSTDDAAQTSRATSDGERVSQHPDRVSGGERKQKDDRR